MNEIAIIIPSRLAAERLPNKPLEKINNKQMILHVHDSAIKARLGQVYVASPDQEILEIVKAHGGEAVKTKFDHKTGTDRIFEVFDKILKRKPEIIINLQGDMPNINSDSIKKLVDHMKKKSCDIGTLASNLDKLTEEKDPNIVKVVTKSALKEGDFSEASDFFRINSQPLNLKTYHHVGIYGFTNKALLRYVDLERSKLELNRKLEQLRALENNMNINVGLIECNPLSVDTKKDLEKIKKLMKLK